MSTNTTKTSAMKTTVFNLIILDESGSMSGLAPQTIAGCNETINVAKHLAEQNADSLRSLVSIYAFQDGGPVKSRYIIKNVNAADVRHISDCDYRPYGNTPLLDAVGATLSELKVVSATHEDATGIITIITDGYENSSTHYDWQQVASLIAQFKELGWTVNLIGANIDLGAMSRRMNIDNTMAFTADKADTARMWSDLNSSTADCISSYADDCCYDSVEERRESRRSKSSKFFDRLKGKKGE